MHENLSIGVISFGVAAALLGSRRVRIAPTLEAKLAALRRMFCWQGVTLAGLLAASFVELSQRSTLRLTADADLPAMKAHLLALQDAARGGVPLVAGLALLGLLVLVAVLHVMGEAQQFVQAQRIDLIARDQVMAHSKKAVV